MPKVNVCSGPFQPDAICNDSPWQPLLDRLPEVGS
jgi:hypothetical protein